MRKNDLLQKQDLFGFCIKVTITFPLFTCLNSTMETLEECVKFIQS